MSQRARSAVFGWALCLVTAVIVGGAWQLGAFESPGEPAVRTAAETLQKAGNFREAYNSFRKLIVEPRTTATLVPKDLEQAIVCLNQLGEVDEIDGLITAAVEAHPQNWRLLKQAALSYLTTEHYGYVVAGKFNRGHRRGGGEFVSSIDRDRVLALQLLEKALPLVGDETAKPEVGEFYNQFAETVFFGLEAWELQVLTDWKQVPDFEPGYYWGRRGRGGGGSTVRGASVDAEGNPVYHTVPKQFADAQSDGQRWRWLLNAAAEAKPGLKNQLDLTWAQFLHTQFGVQTMAGFQPSDDDASNDVDEAAGPFAVHTLKDEETIARLATGIKRFTLPDEFNPLKIYRAIAGRTDDKQYVPAAAEAIAGIYADRRQYVKAAAEWKAIIAKFGDAEHRKNQLNQIVSNWGSFENAQLQPAGEGATVDFRYRNGKKVTFTAHAIKVATLLDDVKAYLKSSPNQLDWQQFNIQDLGHRLVVQNQSKYLGEKTAEWSLDLDPKPEHIDRRITISTPLQKAGAYLLVGQMADGNTSRIVLWVADTALVKKQLNGESWYYVADAVTGRPIEKANVEFFGWKQEQVKPNTNSYRIVTKSFAEFSDADGQLKFNDARQSHEYQWLSIARTDSGRLAYLGFTGVWYGEYHDHQYHQGKIYTITDRPVYRPDQTVKYKFWVGEVKYDQPERTTHANQDVIVVLANPKGETVFEKPMKTDDYGGVEGEHALPKDAPLGVYRLFLKNQGGQGSFRVEEYKKPEFEVTVDAPTEPVMLGEKITATITAKYYFGAPVAKGKVKYKIERTTHSAQWYPTGRWDWFYGRGYWWFAPDYAWYPGWKTWGCLRPVPWWWGRGPAQAELVAEQEVELGADGIVKVEIDTLPAKTVHGNDDHSYTISAEVVDESRRTITGSGSVLVARKPFKVFAWVNRGHYQVGDDVLANFSAATLSQKPVQGKGKLTLYSLTYDEQGQPTETEVQSWDLNTDEQGLAQQQFAASKAGQYRLSYKVTDAAEHTIEGGYVFVVRGLGFDGRSFRFNDLELVTDKREYAPGERVRLLINANRADCAVVLFLRPSNGICLPPKVIRLKGKSTVEEIAVVQKDMPNFFIEAFTIADGKYHQEMREVIVPPEKRVINVAVEPSQSEYKPGQPATVQVKLTDGEGKPFVGSTVLTVYDRSVDYIAGGSNVPEIREFFWKWRRQHHPRHESNLGWTTWNILKPNEIGMSTLGAFGEVGLMEDRFAGNQGVLRKGMAASNRRGMMLEERAAFGAAPAAPMAAKADGYLGSNALADAAGADKAERQLAGGEGGGGGAMVEPTVRSNFADTAYWVASLTTDADGFASVKFNMPENLTGWKVKAWALGAGTKVGEGTVEVTTKKNLLVRLQAPRFFVEKDEVVLSANIHNYLKVDKSVQAVLELEGGCIEVMGATDSRVVIPAGGELRVDWRVKVTREGNATLRMKALSDEESDAMQMTFPVFVHGMFKTESYSGALRANEQAGSLTLNVPAERRINDSRLEVRYSPTLAGAMVDALPYLVEYPYGCTEQTLNRFLPTVITQRILQRMQLDLKAIQEKRTNLNAQELGDPAERAKGWKRFDRNPVFDKDEVTSMVKDGVERLTAMQLSDGGWGWFSGYGEHSYPHTTAVVVHGLQVATQNDVAIVPGVLDRGIEWLKRYQAEQLVWLKNFDDKKKDVRTKAKADALDALVYMILIDADVASQAMNDYLFRDRIDLPVYAKALYGLALHKQQQAERLTTVMQNIDQFLKQDDENQTAWLDLPQNNWWWSWYGSGIEANAYYLKLLTRTNPQDPKAARLVKYLLNNRKNSTYWNSTRDTALCIEALAEYLVASGEAEPNLTIEVWLDGQKQKEVKVDKTNLFTFDNAFTLTGDAVTTGAHKLELRKQGAGPLYYNAYLTNFTLEDFITKAGLEVKVQRKYYKLTRVDKTVNVAGSQGQAVQQKVEKFERTELPNLASLVSGDLVEVELEIDSKNDYEYVLFEDMKASGFEPVDVRSGYLGNALGAYVEFRDERVAFFVRALPQGKHSVSYRLRAEIPGKFSALPTRASAMYAPELKGNSDEIKLQIVDR